MERLHRCVAGSVEAVVDLEVGHLNSFAVEAGGRRLAPLHTAPWVGTDEAVEEAAPNVRRLSGDFLCAPFGRSDIEEAPPHGWPANSPWDVADDAAIEGGRTVRFVLRRRVLGARVVKELTLRDGHPFLYVRHVFEGGTGALPVASHAMTRFGPGGGRLFVSPKLWGETPAEALERDPARGRSALAYPARFRSLEHVPAGDGGTLDLTRQPLGRQAEDFALLVEDPANPLGWAAALRHDEDDLVLSLKNPRVFPVTMLWMSDGGRDYAPWSGRHRGVLGIEEGVTYGGAGHAGSLQPNPLRDAGVPTALSLRPDGAAEVRHVLGAMPAEGSAAVVAIEAEPARLIVRRADGRHQAAPYDAAFLGDA